MSSVPPPQQHLPTSHEEIAEKLVSLNHVYMMYMSACGPGERFDALQQTFYEHLKWFNVRSIELYHIEPHTEWKIREDGYGGSGKTNARSDS